MIMIRFNERFCFSSWDSAAVLFVSGNGDSSFFSGCPFPITIGATNVISKAKKENRNRYICLIVVLKATFGDVAFDGLLHFGKLKIPVIDGIPDIPPGIRQQNPPDKLHNIRLQVHLVSLTLIFSKKSCICLLLVKYVIRRNITGFQGDCVYFWRKKMHTILIDVNIMSSGTK